MGSLEIRFLPSSRSSKDRPMVPISRSFDADYSDTPVFLFTPPLLLPSQTVESAIELYQKGVISWKEHFSSSESSFSMHSDPLTDVSLRCIVRNTLFSLRRTTLILVGFTASPVPHHRSHSRRSKRRDQNGHSFSLLGDPLTLLFEARGTDGGLMCVCHEYSRPLAGVRCGACDASRTAQLSYRVHCDGFPAVDLESLPVLYGTVL